MLNVKLVHKSIKELTYNPNNPRGKDGVEKEYQRFLGRTIDNGLDASPLTINSDGMILKGNIRFRVVKEIDSMGKYDEVFPKGIPCYILPKNITPEQESEIINDHDAVGQSKHEFMLTLINYIDLGHTDKKIVSSRWSDFENFYKRLDNHIELFGGEREQKDGTKEQVKGLLDSNFPLFLDSYAKGRKGVFDQVRRIAKVPFVVRIAWMIQNGLKKHNGEILPKNKLSAAKIGSLNDTHQKENKTNEDATRNHPGPIFTKAWDEVLNLELKEKSTNSANTRKKAQNSDAINDLADYCNTDSLRGIIQAIGDKNQDLPVKAIQELDKDLQVLSWAKSQASEAWNSLVKGYIEAQKG